MEQQKPISHIAAGLIIGALLILLSFASVYLGSKATSLSQWGTYIVMIGGLITFIVLYGNALNNQVTFGNLFSYGFKATAVFTLVVIAFIVVFNMISPDFREKGFEMARQNLESNKKLTDEQVDQYMTFAHKYFWVFAIGGTILGNIIIGAIGSLIGAAVTKKRPYNPLEQLPS
jgi:uncharacterized membrane protein YbhN (UPF0104 family)